MRPLTCSGCGGPISTQSKTGRCRSCVVRAINADPAVQERRRAAITAKFADPAHAAAHAARLVARNRNPSEKRRDQLRQQGAFLQTFQTPELRARLNDPAMKRENGRKRTERLLGWCPPPLRPLYLSLCRSQRLPAAEARRIVEAEIPGTIEHALRGIANHELKARLRQEREQAEAY